MRVCIDTRVTEYYIEEGLAQNPGAFLKENFYGFMKSSHQLVKSDIPDECIENIILFLYLCRLRDINLA